MNFEVLLPKCTEFIRKSEPVSGFRLNRFLYSEGLILAKEQVVYDNNKPATRVAGSVANMII